MKKAIARLKQRRKLVPSYQFVKGALVNNLQVYHVEKVPNRTPHHPPFNFAQVLRKRSPSTSKILNLEEKRNEHLTAKRKKRLRGFEIQLRILTYGSFSSNPKTLAKQLAHKQYLEDQITALKEI